MNCIGGEPKGESGTMKRVKRIRKDNPELVRLIELFNKSQSNFWKKVSYELARPRKQWAHVNLSKLDKFASEKNDVVVPGKVLGAGKLNKKLQIYAFDFSQSARESISKSGGKAKYLEELFEKNKTGKDVIIIR